MTVKNKIISFTLSVVLLILMLPSNIVVTAGTDYWATFSVGDGTEYLLCQNDYPITVNKYPSNLQVTFRSSDTDVLEIANGVICPSDLGVATVTMTYLDEYDEEMSVSQTFIVVDTLGLETNTSYYIMNVATGYLMGSSSTVNYDYANVVTLNQDWTQRSKWRFVQLLDGRYNLYGFDNASGIILKTFGTSVELETQEGSDSEKFSIYRIEGSAFSGQYYIRQGDYYVAQDSNNNVYLTQNLSPNARWTIMKANKGNTAIYAFDAPIEGRDYDSTTHASLFCSTMRNLGYTATCYENDTANNAYNNMPNLDVFVFRGHGNSGLIAFYSSNGALNGHIISAGSYTSHSYPVDDYGRNELSDLRCVLFLGCETGVDWGDSNLVDETFNKGAHFVLGTTESMTTDSDDLWLENFLYYINQGYTIEQAISVIDDDDELIFYYSRDGGNTYLSTQSMPIHHVGDGKQKLKFG